MRTLLVTAVFALSCCLSRPALAADVASREVTFQSGGVRMSGTLFSPVASGSHPAMVVMPGSGSETRAPLLGIARDFAAQGMVTLVYDKQGVGQSGGDWTREGLEDLAGDALSAIGFMKGLPEVDPDRIGAWGISQSGWVLPRLARQYPGLAFMVCVTGGGATTREVEYYGYHNALLHSGLNEADWSEARLLVDRYMDYLATGLNRKALLDAIKAASGKPWSRVLGLERVVPAEADQAKWSWVPSYDPSADIRALRMPVLVLVGGRDPFSPADVTIQRWQAGLTDGAATDKLISYPIAGHGIRTNGHDLVSAPVYAPGFLEDQFAWLKGIGVLR